MHAMPPKGARFDSLAAFNQELGGTDDFQSNLNRYGQRHFFSTKTVKLM